MHGVHASMTHLPTLNLLVLTSGYLQVLPATAALRP